MAKVHPPQSPSLVGKHQRPVIQRELNRLLLKLRQGGTPQHTHLTPRMWLCREGEITQGNTAADVFTELKRGRFLVRLDPRAGSLTVEGCAEYYRMDIMDAVFTTVAQNADLLRSMQVILYDHNGGIVSTVSSDFTVVPAHERFHHIPTLCASPTGKAWRAVWEWVGCKRQKVAALDTGEHAARLLARACLFD